MTAINTGLLTQFTQSQQSTPAPSPQEIEDIVRGVLNTLESGLSLQEIAFYAELEKLHDFIENAKEEIRSIRPDEIQDEHLPQAQDELCAVVRATEEATGKILDAAEMIEEVADLLDGAPKERLLAAATAIYEASNFQDITGQRITKVTTVLRHIDEKISSLLVAFAPEKPKAPAKQAPKASSDQTLLNGPQLPENAKSQEDIDALFDTL